MVQLITGLRTRAHMSHLSTERLAALGDEEPTAAESAHLAACADCARERSAYRTLVAMARAERDAIGIPLTRWESVASALAAEPLAPISETTRGPALAPAARERAIRFTRLPMRAAAGFLLLAGGVLAGRVSAGAPAVPFGGGSTATSR